jgi:DNA-binding transcriptional regulator GbsR (MarR family)
LFRKDTNMSEGVQLTDQQKRLIEQLGVYYEKSGTPPAHARILALLTVSPQTELTFDQIRDTLQLSKSATSNAINMLMNTEKVDYITKTGDRKRYFKNKIGTWREEMQNSFHKITKVSDLLEEVLEQRPPETAKYNNDLKDIISFMRFINKELPEMYKKWEKSKE